MDFGIKRGIRKLPQSFFLVKVGLPNNYRTALLANLTTMSLRLLRFDKTKFLYTTSPPKQHHSFFRNYPLHSFVDKLEPAFFGKISNSLSGWRWGGRTASGDGSVWVIFLGGNLAALVFLAGKHSEEQQDKEKKRA